MAATKTMHGARASLIINGQVAGIFNSCSYGVQYDSNPIYTLGRFNANEIVVTGMAPISLQLGGFRVIDNGPYEIASVPKLQELLNLDDITVAIHDRQTNKTVLTVVGVKPTGYSTDVSARGLQSLNVTMEGISLGDESDESPQEDIGGTEY